MSAESSNIWDKDDEWAGVSSSRERRKRQNRLHQRAYRECYPHPDGHATASDSGPSMQAVVPTTSKLGAKKRLEKFPVALHAGLDVTSKATTIAGGPNPSVSAVIQSTTSRQEQARLFTAVIDQLPLLILVRCTGLHERIKEFLQMAFTNWGLNLPAARDLPLVTRLNTFAALARNALMLQIPFEMLETDELCSIFNYQGPATPDRSNLPEALRPTELQRAVTHYSWLDLFPIPKMRDNILRGIEAGIYDEDVLCETLCCELLNLEDGANAALVVWGESWDAAGWEFSAEFFSKWAPLLYGCDEVLESTNYWRRKRGARCLEFVLS
ncbi:hypothetical protein CKAH01_17997 [Colletotrichum kahawae]|uniref:Aryl-alcohol dehydrogenase n=1 Tax=Colletotrichum kahawae TaxID=34407 RepID=A0AAD9Y9Z2_COLKA|nr:hypothetical protein CKAH01_17997 [Colletotrichum kahawae]